MTWRKFFVKFCPLDISAINTLNENNVRIEIFSQVTSFEKASMASNWRLRAGDTPISNILILAGVRLCIGFCSKDLKKHGVRTGRFHRLGRCFTDWATAVVGEGYTCQLSVSFPYHSSGPIYEILAQSTEFDGTTCRRGWVVDLSFLWFQFCPSKK